MMDHLALSLRQVHSFSPTHLTFPKLISYLIHCPTTGETAAVDTPCAKSYESELAKRGWTLTHILNTHHHWDHTGGNAELKKDGEYLR